MSDILTQLRQCAASHDPDVRLVGNVRAGDIVAECDRFAAVERERAALAEHYEGKLPPGLFSEYTRLDAAWQKLVRELDEARSSLDAAERELAPVLTAQRTGSVLVPVSPELLVEGAFTEQPLHVMLTDNGDGTHTLTFRESDELRTLRTRADAAERRVEAVTKDQAVLAAKSALASRIGQFLYGSIKDQQECVLAVLNAALAAASGDTTATTEG